MSTEFKLSSNSNKEIIYLVDATAYVYRAYYAVKGLYNSKGQPTNAVFGFVRMLMKLIDEKSPKYLAMFFDVKGPTFRHKQYQKYKSNRLPMPKDLIKQLSWIKQAVVSFGLPLFEISGFEADDLIGTTARIVQKKGFRVVVVTSDKDFMQIVTDNCILWDPVKEITIDINSIRSLFGVNPEQIVEIMGLSGDRADNIPGVPGIGPKTALSLIKKFGDIESCYENINNISQNKQKDNLIKFKEQAFLSRTLALINVNSPISIKIKKLLLLEPDKKALKSLFKKLDFKQLQKMFTQKACKEEKKYEVILDKNKLNKHIFKLGKSNRFSLNIHTDSINPMIANLVGLSFAIKLNEAFYIPLGHDYPGAPEQLPLTMVLDSLKPILMKSNIEKIGHNIGYTLIVFLRYGISISGIKFDTMIASYLVNSNKRNHTLNQISIDFLDYERINYQDLVGKGKNKISFNKVLIEKAYSYASEGADITLLARNILISILEKHDLMHLMENVEIPLISILAHMEMNGVCIDKRALEKSTFSLQSKLLLLEKKIYKSAGQIFNINSSQQLSCIIFEQLKLPLQKKTKTNRGYSTDIKVLKKLKKYHDLPVLVLEYRKLSKLKSTYVDSILELINASTKRIHTSFNQTATATGRLSSSKPNLQNIPIRSEEGREIRKSFVSVKNCYFLSADYSQIELRVLAHCSKDSILIDSFKREEDIHARTASEIFQISPKEVNKELRRQAKAVNFGIIYGISAYGLAKELNISNNQAQAYIDKYFVRYKKVKIFISETINIANKEQKIKTLMGRIRYIKDMNNSNRNLRKNSERSVINTVIQGTAADLMKVAMINVDLALMKSKFKTKMLLSVHDEIIFEVPFNEMDQVKSVIKDTMESVANFLVPLKVNLSYGKNWAEMNKI